MNISSRLKHYQLEYSQKKHPLQGVALAIVIANASPATAENSAEEDLDSIFEEIIVTAQKREENMQEVPIAISALGAKTLEKRGISSPESLQFSVPGLTIGSNFGATAQVTIRGVGAENITVGGDPGVPLNIDGNYIQDSSYMLRDMFDVERVEVLRGPQGTLYGRNAVGGNINIITKRPTKRFEGNISAEVGNYSKHLVQGVVSGPLANDLRGRIAFSTESRDGYVENVTNGDDLLNSDYTMVRGSLEYDLAEHIELFLSAYNYESKSRSPVARIVNEYPQQAVFLGFIPNPYLAPDVGNNITVSDPRKVRLSLTPDHLDKSKGGSLNISWNLLSMRFRSLTAYTDSGSFDSHFEIDGSDSVYSDSDYDIGFRTWSQEFQLLSNDVSSLKWVLGAFYYQEESISFFNLDSYSIFGPGNPPTNYQYDSDVESTSASLFGQMDYAITEELELIAGLRYNRDEKELHEELISLDLGFVAPDGTPLTIEPDDSWTKMTWKLGLNYFFNSDVLLYASYSTGYKAGGFNAGALQESSYDPETIDAFEAGLKSEILDHKLQLNLSAFHYDYKDKQENQVETVQPFLKNAGAATVVGAELEMRARPTNALSIDAAINWQKGEYDKYYTVDPVFPELMLQDLSGNQLSRSPEWKAYLGIQYMWQLGNLGSLSARADYSWIDDQYYRPYNLDIDEQEAYHRTNIRLAWESEDNAWSADFYIKNLEDDDIRSNQLIYAGSLGNVVSAQYFSPRTYGVVGRYNF